MGMKGREECERKRREGGGRAVSGEQGRRRRKGEGRAGGCRELGLPVEYNFAIRKTSI
jgi:hypothetical protein